MEATADVTFGADSASARRGTKVPLGPKRGSLVCWSAWNFDVG